MITLTSVVRLTEGELYRFNSYNNEQLLTWNAKLLGYLFRVTKLADTRMLTNQVNEELHMAWLRRSRKVAKQKKKAAHYVVNLFNIVATS